MKEVVHFDKPKAGGHHETVEKILIKLRQSVNVVVSLVNMCREHDKVDNFPVFLSLPLNFPFYVHVLLEQESSYLLHS